MQEIQLPERLQGLQGVQFNPPPPEFIGQTTSMLADAVKNIKVDKNGTLMFVANHREGKTSLNYAIVVQTDDGDLKVMHWLGKTWGRPLEVGIAATLSF